MPYDEVLRFRKSAAKYVEDNATTLHQMMELIQTVGLTFGWYDNFDLLVSTPNGRRETRAKATEFQTHPINGNKEPGISTLMPHIPSADITAGQICGQKQGHTCSALYRP